ncbi:GTPase ObgE [Corynebacterium pseudotuberculosis]|uniref:GTPase Obg n=1 Tax=Corynebacterium pseudotuberculosis (strain C231) TaxID=681645 RepID=D9QBX1_CORP2|nr:GTPase ObgE [Corynebacterium pseudotuberculosis]ADK29383.1 GTPase ObgE [Corynebacterium pseudotuberculosis FRC41]ADL11047.1 GTPase ObgE [Corynebacterium pseudotuberculosis C231]ADL21452.1 GTPase ObgE [Corynebacterium pseudotuberculosis 1002]ADO26846.1 GTPase ObgE [Corynebacterium pseudotuberculosis I19]AEK92911.1 GTPase ObgE [Corynebacterium pseudotuberculosis PAT10]
MARFVDRVVLHLEAGDGGNGCASVHREKFKPLGGPDGGNGGHGGDIVLEVSNQVHTLLDLHYRPNLKAKRGANGAGDHRNGARGDDLVLEVPAGTVVLAQNGETLADLTSPGMKFVAAKGGFGGLGNAALASAARKAPGFALKGEPGEAHDVVLELKSMADVGLVGFPSAGKSSLISVLSAAKPKIGDYPFTTLQPNLGVVEVGHDTFTIADVPGLIPGASEGKGLGLDFLRHIERTAVLAHVVDAATMEPGRDPISDIEALETELAAYQSALDEDTGLGDLRDRPRIVILNKVDIPDALELAEFLKEDIEAKFGWPVFIISAVARKGLDPLRYKLLEIVQEDRRKRPKQKREERIVVRPQAVDSRKKKKDFEIIEDPDVENGYVVLGEKPERWIIQTDFENDEAVGYLADRLARMGVEEELFKKGARPGCTVSIGEVSFEWEPTTAAGVEVTMSGRGTDMRLDKNTRMSASERKRASQVRRGLIDEFDFGEGQEVTRESANRDRWQG